MAKKPMAKKASTRAPAAPSSGKNGFKALAMHITEANAPLTAYAMPSIVAGLRAKHLRIVKLSTLLAADNRPN